MSEKILSALRNPFKFRLFMLRKLPMAFIAGLSLAEIDEERAAVCIRYKYLTQNPFRSLYFACLAMAAELASGILSIVHVSASGKAVSMLVVKMEADFTKKAVGKIIFTCADGIKIQKAIQESIQTGEGRTLVATSIGLDETGDKVAEFRITWSYKVKK
jgi:hypothetical protein